jgi:hypothetical protein
VRLNDPQLVRDEYASEAGLEARYSIYSERIGRVLGREVVARR